MAIIVERTPEIVLALTLGAARLDVRAVELASCPRCHDRPERYTCAAMALRTLLDQLLEDDHEGNP